MKVVAVLRFHGYGRRSQTSMLTVQVRSAVFLITQASSLRALMYVLEVAYYAYKQEYGNPQFAPQE